MQNLLIMIPILTLKIKYVLEIEYEKEIQLFCNV